MSVPPPLPSAARPRPATSKALLWTVFARVLMFLIFVISVGIVSRMLYQVYVTFPPLGQQIKHKDSERSLLASEVQQLEMDWNAAAAEKLDQEYHAAQEQLFAEKAEQEQWSGAIRSQAKKLAFDVLLTATEPQVHPQETNVSVVNATLQLQQMRLGGGQTNSAYERLLVLNSAFENSKRRVDFVELSVVSDSNSVARTQAKFQLWTQAKAKEKATP